MHHAQLRECHVSKDSGHSAPMTHARADILPLRSPHSKSSHPRFFLPYFFSIRLAAFFAFSSIWFCLLVNCSSTVLVERPGARPDAVPPHLVPEFVVCLQDGLYRCAVRKERPFSTGVLLVGQPLHLVAILWCNRFCGRWGRPGRVRQDQWSGLSCGAVSDSGNGVAAKNHGSTPQ